MKNARFWKAAVHRLVDAPKKNILKQCLWMIHSTIPKFLYLIPDDGECREDSPCQHLCFDLHDGTFECACKDGFTLSVNGYSCIENSKLRDRDWRNASLWMENGTSSEEFFNSEDIDSMPSFHTLDDESPESRAYHQNDGVEIKFETLDKEFKRRTHHRPISYEHLHENSASRSLNSFNVHPQEHVVPKTVSHGDVFQPMNTIAVSTPSVHQVFHTCSELQCEHGGNCVLEETSKHTVRCKCPLGYGGTFCEQDSCICQEKSIIKRLVAGGVFLSESEAMKRVRHAMDSSKQVQYAIIQFLSQKVLMESTYAIE
ncbi:hypothetical protein AVEN_150540-1 [Araneus ventricosus]|uniref:EGF-like domain-containing protein n=1 Tax=Araneus ventricosus TaxID=182803 RepID=A0A4Y2E491_ARAVE|nr:hypothetical protein AVEN_150540-1 [Araneus ventricosus]